MARSKKFQFVMDSLIEQCLKEIRGQSQTDKIRWALCVYAEIQRLERIGNPQYTAQMIMERASNRYRQGDGKPK